MATPTFSVLVLTAAPAGLAAESGGAFLKIDGRESILRSVELFLVWHRPGRAHAARVLWDAIRAEWRDRATGVGALVDPRGTLHDAMPVGRMPAPDIRLTVAVRSPKPIAEDRLIYLWR